MLRAFTGDPNLPVREVREVASSTPRPVIVLEGEDGDEARAEGEGAHHVPRATAIEVRQHSSKHGIASDLEFRMQCPFAPHPHTKPTPSTYLLNTYLPTYLLY